MRGVTVAALVASAVVTWDELRDGHMPCPSRYTGIVLVFGVIGLVSGPAPGLAAAVAWALVIALVLAKDSNAVKKITRKKDKPKPKAAQQPQAAGAAGG